MKVTLILSVLLFHIGIGAIACSDDTNDVLNFNTDTDSDTDTNSDTNTNSDLDWWTSSCDELGGVLTPAGACFIGCQSTEDCPLGILYCTRSNVWAVGNCNARASAKDCGPKGWLDPGWGCYMECSNGDDKECPSGFRCVDMTGMDGKYFCTGHSGGGGGSDCNVDCPDNCCSISGNMCCEPPFCSGECSSSPCCN